MRYLRQTSTHTMLAGAVAALLAVVPALAQDTRGAVEQTIPPPVSQKPNVPPVHLTDQQRATIRRALSGVNSEVDLKLKANKPAQSFTPTVGATIPKQLHPQTLPPPVLDKMPLLERYTYVKFKQQVLIVNPMSRKIVDVFPEASG